MTMTCACLRCGTYLENMAYRFGTQRLLCNECHPLWITLHSHALWGADSPVQGPEARIRLWVAVGDLGMLTYVDEPQ